MNEDQVKREMNAVLDLVKSDITSVRTGRSTPSLVEDIVIPAYGGTQKLRLVELANITAPDSLTIEIRPWDKSIIGDIKKGLLSANIGVNPAIDSELIRISFPPLTTEDRQKYVKILATKIEQGKVMIRQVRTNAMRDIKKAFEEKKIPEDEKFSQEKSLQDLTDDYTKKIDEIGEAKKQDLLQA
jgi:ribosome recycling factor